LETIKRYREEQAVERSGQEGEKANPIVKNMEVE